MNKSIYAYGVAKRRYHWLSIVVIFISTLCNLLSFYFGYKVIAGLLSPGVSYPLLYRYAAYIVAAKALQALLLALGLRLSHIFAYYTLGELRRGLLKKMAVNPLGESLKYPAGYVRQKLVDSVESMEIIFAHMIPEGLPYVISFFVTLILTFFVDYRMGFLMLIPVAINLGSMMIMQQNAKGFLATYYEAVKRMSGHLAEFISGIAVIKIFNRKDKQYRKLGESIRFYKDYTMKWYRVSYIPLALSYAFGTTLTLAVLPVGALFVFRGSLDLSRLILVCLLGFSLAQPAVRLVMFMAGHMNLQQRFTEIEKDFAAPELITGERTVERIESIEFRDVHFAYEDVEVIKGVSFTVRQGEQIAFVGESGSGKSTLAKLLLHYYDTSAGDILINGISIREIALESLMERIAYVSQDNYLFNTSIRQNLLLAKENASEEELIAACRSAYIYDRITELDDGFDTIVGQDGTKLSGGEKQRICIARAILKDADIIILDEATAYTDPENEFKIIQAVAELTRNRILISIAHKLSTIAAADKILLLEEGLLTAEGNHNELLANATYRRLWERFKGADAFEFTVRREEA